MASRDKKFSVNKRQTASPLPPKEVTAPAEASTKDDPPKAAPSPKAPAVKSASVIAKKLSKTAAKKAIKKTLAIQMKSKTAPRINKKLAKSLLSTVKPTLERKKSALLKNGIKIKQIRKTKVPGASATQEVGEDEPPVLEPILPVVVESENKKQPKKRPKKVITFNSSTIDETIESIIKQVAIDEIKTAKKPKVIKKTKQDPPANKDSIEDVMKDLSSLISSTVKNENDSPVDNIQKPKKYSKKQIDILKRRMIKKENIENTLKQLESCQSDVIDMLDLNVQKFKRIKPIGKRRHSIEKFPIGALDSDNAPTIAQLKLFSNIPRSISPRVKRAASIRQSIDSAMRPSLRSDTPIRILRNGKHRRLRDLNSLDDLLINKKRKRIGSELSGSELSINKSGYDSDSSFSDLASLHGDQNNVEVKTEVPKKELSPAPTETENCLILDIPELKLPVKISVATEKEENGFESKETVTDTNSNVFEDKKPLEPDLIFNEPPIPEAAIPNSSEACFENLSANPSHKVPDKTIILNIMKQTFNDIINEEQEKDKRTTRATSKKRRSSEDPSVVPTSKFYGPDTSLNQPQTSDTKDDILNPVDIQVETPAEKQPEEEVNVQETTLPPVVPEEIIQTEVFTEESTIGEEAKQPIEMESEEVVKENSEEEPILIEPIEEEIKPSTSNEVIQEEIIQEETIQEETIQVQPEEKCDKNEIKESVEPMAIVEEPQIPENFTNGDLNHILEKQPTPVEIEETPENLAIKENILQALGLQSLKAAEEQAKEKEKSKGASKGETYTGTLKTVIKLNRCEKKKGKSSLKMTLQKKSKSSDSDVTKAADGADYKIMKEKEAGASTSTSWKSHGNQSSDTAGAHRKSHYSNRSNNMDGSSEHTSDGDTTETQGEGSAKALVIPEKASSFSIHPGRLCKDECSYCFGKFGLFDTPCHIAQMKSVERQDKILSAEKHLTRDSCLCDACYRHVDRKSNTPSYTNKSSFKRSSLVAPGPRQNHCHVLGCPKVAVNILKRKWIIKMKKAVCQILNIDLANHGLHSIPICQEHYSALQHLMICAMCKRTLASNHMHNLGPESTDLNSILQEEGIPVVLSERPIVCKLCRYFAMLLLKDPEERPENTANFFTEYKKRLLHFHGIEQMDEAEAEEPIPVPSKEKSEKENGKKKKKTRSQSDGEQPPVLEPQVNISKPDQQRLTPEASKSNSQSRSESPSDYMIDYNTLIPKINMECGSDVEMTKRPSSEKPLVLKKVSRPELIKEAVEISKNIKVQEKNSDIAVQRLGSNPCLSVRQLFPGEEDLQLQGHIDFSNIKERTPEGWEKCTTTIQYDVEMKNLWQELQKPYGNQSSFLRHLILLEKYFRNGDLVLAPNANSYSKNYSESVRNRLRAYDNIPSLPALSVVPVVKAQKSSSGIITSKEVPNPSYILNAANIPKNTPITISQLTSTNFMTQTNGTSQKQAKVPGLISLQPGTNKPVAPPLTKLPQSRKIKFPMPKNWRPNLIPVDPSKKLEKKPGLIHVTSAGKPYFITIEDYKKMCAIKRNFELKREKQIQEVQRNFPGTSVLKEIGPKKGLVITKTSESQPIPPPAEPIQEVENSLEKLDKQVEKLEAKFNNDRIILPKIPKSLTVIPQTVARKNSSPSSPALMIMQKKSTKS